MSDLTQVGRIAFRHEGEMWNAYYAMPETMDDAILLGSIRMAAVADDANRKELFIAVMRSIVSDIIESKVGIKPDWKKPHRAPEHERAGHS